MCFESVSAHLTFYNNAVVLIFFNKLLRSSWNEVAHSIIPSLSIKPGCIYILIGLNWGALSQNSSMYNLKYTCEHYSDEFVANSEILEYIHGKKFLAYVDLKPRSEKEIFTFMDSIVKLVVMKDKGYNLFEKDFLAKVDDISR
ncbi:predicted protein [Naegleria gruberi]|uniref:Predicted protein n=1 Tax=Naegleria gruberi TaxID=5762 RepID=D2VQN3_NAEGR|nr:uncharacterized protein NAEGRDRAFT_71287 [Naegleria gruberi]EFC40901.1 predicted protein [Naegleria gruberi]|eukprot:XP_002673645.1 predicted protein [Naegleria gruberi strain NEG-M]